MLPYPSIDPVAVRIGPLAIRWYGIAYLLGFGCAYAVLRRRAAKGALPLPPAGVGDLLSYLIAGLLIGGRLGYALFYNLPYFAENPLRVFAVWEGGMSFHGGLAGVVFAGWLFARRRGIGLLRLGDSLALAAPPGLFLGRLANFVNGELYGRPTNLPWGMIFPGGGPVARHPSQLYEAVLEGLVLWGLVGLAARYRGDIEGRTSAVFLVGYGVLRFVVEFTRQPDPQLGLLLGVISMGQLLSVLLAGLGLAIWAAPRRR